WHRWCPRPGALRDPSRAGRDAERPRGWLGRERVRELARGQRSGGRASAVVRSWPGSQEIRRFRRQLRHAPWQRSRGRTSGKYRDKGATKDELFGALWLPILGRQTMIEAVLS